MIWLIFTPRRIFLERRKTNGQKKKEIGWQKKINSIKVDLIYLEAKRGEEIRITVI